MAQNRVLLNLSLSLTLLLPVMGHATAVNINDTKCVNAAATKVADFLVIPDRWFDRASPPKYVASLRELAKGSIPDLFLGALPSQRETQLELMTYDVLKRSETERTESFFVWVKLRFRPAANVDAKYFPRFLMKCTTNWNELNKKFNNLCSLVAKPAGYGFSAEYLPYGLDSMTSDITTTEDDANCPGKTTSVAYKIALQTNAAEVKEILTAGYGTIMATLAPYMPGIERKFFADFYREFYNYIIKKL